jgi:S-adenosylmethionine/arginine decarboxylase-like enzyme
MIRAFTILLVGSLYVISIAIKLTSTEILDSTVRILIPENHVTVHTFRCVGLIHNVL